MPWPFSRRTSVGIDISDRSIEVAELARRGRAITVTSVGRTILSSGIVVHGRVVDGPALEQALRTLLASATPRPIIARTVSFGLPESQLYTRSYTLPPHDRHARARLVFEEAWKSVPIPGNELRYAYREVGTTDDGRVDVLLVAAERVVVEEWEQFFWRMGIAVAHIESGLLAVFRGVMSTSVPHPVCLMDCGAMTATIAVFDRRGLRYVHTVRIAGDAITTAIARELRVNVGEAEARKMTLDLRGSDRALVQVVTGTLASMCTELSGILAHVFDRTHERVQEVVIVGGTSRLMGLSEFIQAQLGIPVRLGQPSMPLPSGSSEGNFFAGAIGLALRDLDVQRSRRDPEIPVERIGRLRGGDWNDQESSEETAVGSAVDESMDVARDAASIRRSAEQTRRRTFLFIGIMVVGLGVLGAAFWYRARERAQRAESIETGAVRFTEAQTIELAIPMAVHPDAFRDDRMRGRIASVSILTAGDYAEAIAQARISVDHALGAGERAWGMPYDPPPNPPSAITFPFTVRWIVFTSADVDRLVRTTLTARAGDIPFAIGTIAERRIEPSADPRVFTLHVAVNVAVNTPIPSPSEGSGGF